MALSRNHRLTKKRDFDFVFKHGTIVRGALLTARFASVVDSLGRFGIMIPARLIKTAAKRNQVRRKISETIRLAKIKSFIGFDVIISLIKTPQAPEGVEVDLNSILLRIK